MTKVSDAGARIVKYLEAKEKELNPNKDPKDIMPPEVRMIGYLSALRTHTIVAIILGLDPDTIDEELIRRVNRL